MTRDAHEFFTQRSISATENIEIDAYRYLLIDISHQKKGLYKVENEDAFQQAQYRILYTYFVPGIPILDELQGL
jgi:hypothetical protein